MIDTFRGVAACTRCIPHLDGGWQVTGLDWDWQVTSAWPALRFRQSLGKGQMPCFVTLDVLFRVGILLQKSVKINNSQCKLSIFTILNILVSGIKHICMKAGMTV